MISECLHDDIPRQNYHFEYCCTSSLVIFLFHLESEHCKPNKAECHQKKSDIINDRICCRKRYDTKSSSLAFTL